VIEPDPRLVFLRRLALLCALTVFIVTSLSAWLRLSKDGLACAGWPQCYEQTLRQHQAGAAVASDDGPGIAAARLAHRVAAVSALVLVLMLVMTCVSLRPVPRAEAAMALALLAIVVGLAVLGRWSAHARVPAVALGNVLGGFAMLALSVRLTQAGRPRGGGRWRGGVALAVGLLLAQVALGTLVSASHAGLACTEGWAECLRAARGVDAGALAPWREPLLAALPRLNPAGPLAQAWHLGMALVVVVAASIVAVVALRRGHVRRAGALLVLLGLQVVVGTTVAEGALSIGGVEGHHLIAQGLLVVLVLLA
jgi:cytochrome c oxidase assembly protein subunit 15